MIGLLGLNHKSAPISIREKFVFCEEDIKRFVPSLLEQSFRGVIILSTCNRTEFYFDVPDNSIQGSFQKLENELFRSRKTDKNVVAHFYKKQDDEAINHLFRVSSGLDSMALGEYQIVGQLKDGINISEKHGFLSPVLIRLFNKAFEAGKKVRTYTELSKGAISVSYAAVELAGKKLQGLASQPILLIGAGQTGELTVQNLKKKGCNQFTIINRTYEKACELAERYNGESEEFNNLLQLLAQNNLVICSTASKKAIITKELVEQVMEERGNTPLLFIDLSVPRNVARDVEEIENVFVYDIDALNAIVDETFEKRKGEISKAEEIIAEIVTEFTNWHCSRNLTPTFQNISENFQEINKKELEGFIKRQNGHDTQNASAYAEHITNKFIRLMIKNVKSITDNGRKQEYINLVNQLFDIKQ